MSDEGKLWLGTGSGSIYLFSVVAGVANPSQRVVALAKQAGIEHSSKFRDRIGSGGLLSSVVEDEAEENHLEKRRRTNFGYTFRGGTRNRLGTSSPGVYKLIFVESLQSYPNSTEPVRTLLNIRLVLYCCACMHVYYTFPLVFIHYSPECVVSCVNCPADWQQGVQFWTREDSTNEVRGSVCDILDFFGSQHPKSEP